MQYTLVNGRRPRDATHCVLCPAELTDSYVRDCGTGLHYCSHFCVEEHISQSELPFHPIQAIERSLT